jgi:hypothetical protein
VNKKIFPFNVKKNIIKKCKKKYKKFLMSFSQILQKRKKNMNGDKLNGNGKF